MWVFRLLSNEKTHTWIFPLLNHSKFLWFIIAQSYNIVAGTSLVETSKLLITCDKKNHAWPSATCDFFYHSWLAILMFQLVRFQQQYIYQIHNFRTVLQTRTVINIILQIKLQFAIWTSLSSSSVTIYFFRGCNELKRGNQHFWKFFQVEALHCSALEGPQGRPGVNKNFQKTLILV